MKETKEAVTGLDRWISCEYAFSHIAQQSPDSVLNLDYSCDQPDLIGRASPGKVNDFINVQGELISRSIELFPFGETREKKVRLGLEKTCAPCPFYKKRGS